jgi:hypothetical protein
MKTITAVIEIKVDDENIQNLYPNFYEHFANVEDFIQAIYESVQSESDNSLHELGYSVKIIPNATLLPITYSNN